MEPAELSNKIFTSIFGQLIPRKRRQIYSIDVSVEKLKEIYGGSGGRSPPEKFCNFSLVFADFCIKIQICKISKKGLYFWLKHKMASGGGELLHKDGKFGQGRLREFQKSKSAQM